MWNLYNNQQPNHAGSEPNSHDSRTRHHHVKSISYDHMGKYGTPKTAEKQPKTSVYKLTMEKETIKTLPIYGKEKAIRKQKTANEKTRKAEREKSLKGI